MAVDNSKFMRATRRKLIPLPAINKPVGGGIQTIVLPKVGLLGGLYLTNRFTLASASGDPNPLGYASIIKRVRVQTNSSVDVINISGAGYHYLYRDTIDSENFNVTPQSNARSTVANGSANLDMYFPISVNRRDTPGLLMLQNESTVVTLSIEFETDSAIATDVVVSGSVIPVMEIFTVPSKSDELPDLSSVIQVLENTEAIAAAGSYQYQVPRGGVYLSISQGFGFGVSGTDKFSNVATRANQSDYWSNLTPNMMDTIYSSQTGKTRLPGVITTDYLSSSGLGNYGLVRDIFNSSLVTSFEHVITATGADTLYTVRRQIIGL